MNEPKININVMPGAQMNGHVDKQNNYFGNDQKIESSGKEQGPRKGMSTGQLVLLFSELLGASLDSTYGNPSQLADLIAKVVGGNSETIRQKIMEIGKKNNYGKQVKADAEMVAKLIEPYKPELATDLRNTYIDD